MSLLWLRLDDERVGLTLWGPVGEDLEDRVCAAGGAFVLASSDIVLARWLSEGRCESFPAPLAARAARLLTGEAVEIMGFDLSAAPRGLAELGASLPQGCALLNALNMAWDIARTLGRDDLCAAMRAPAPLGQVMDWLTPIVGPDEVPPPAVRAAAARAAEGIIEALRAEVSVLHADATLGG